MNQMTSFKHALFLQFNLRVLLTFCLIFCQVGRDVAYKSVAYNKSMYDYPLFAVVRNDTVIRRFYLGWTNVFSLLKLLIFPNASCNNVLNTEKLE